MSMGCAPDRWDWGGTTKVRGRMTTMNRDASSTLPESKHLTPETLLFGSKGLGSARTPDRWRSAEARCSREGSRRGSGERIAGRPAVGVAARSRQRVRGVLCGGFPLPLCLCVLLVTATLIAVSVQAAEEPDQARVCRPLLAEAPKLQLSQSGVFRWTCSSQGRSGDSYYIVFVRPSGTYVLLKVPDGKTEFEFSPDVEGQWRWIVINTDPDRTKPDVESEPGGFSVTPMTGVSP
jgi:hypothetical protein